MNENLKAFIQKVSEDSELKEKVTAITGSLSEAKEKLIRIAEDYGYSFTAEDIDAAGNGKEQLSNDELMAVSGGEMTLKEDPDGSYHLYSDCYCPIAGIGYSDSFQKTCVCVAGGAGELTALGKQRAEEGQLRWRGSEGGKVAMWCAVLGFG